MFFIMMSNIVMILMISIMIILIVIIIIRNCFQKITSYKIIYKKVQIQNEIVWDDTIKPARLQVSLN